MSVIHGPAPVTQGAESTAAGDSGGEATDAAPETEPAGAEGGDDAVQGGSPTSEDSDDAETMHR